MPELALDHPERVFDLGPYARFGTLQLVQDGGRDPEMHQTKKGNQWHFGMKAHIGVDDASGLVHHVECTAANVADVTQVHKLLHGK